MGRSTSDSRRRAVLESCRSGIIAADLHRSPVHMLCLSLSPSFKDSRRRTADTSPRRRVMNHGCFQVQGFAAGLG